MMSSKCLILLVVLLLTGCYADVEVTWDWPTARENGEFLEMSEIEGAMLRYQRAGDEPIFLALPGLDNRHLLEDVPSGTWSFSVAAVGVGGETSNYSESRDASISLTGNLTNL